MARFNYDESSTWEKIGFWLSMIYAYIMCFFVFGLMFATCANLLTMNRNMEKIVHQEVQSLKEELLDEREDSKMSLKAKKE